MIKLTNVSKQYPTGTHTEFALRDVALEIERDENIAMIGDSIAHAKTLTDRPVVAVGRYTSPDTMAQALRTGQQDLIGAARPSIADPFLPRKIDEGRTGDIRECIGCNICYAHDSLGVPIRCTQNPTMGEEWRLGWHPERVPPAVAATVSSAGPTTTS